MKKLKVGQKYKVDNEMLKKRFGKSIREYGEVEFIEIYSENSGTCHFKTDTGEIITLKHYEVC